MPEIDHILSSSGSTQSGENASSSQENVDSSLSVHSVKNNDTRLLLETAEGSKELAACHFLISAFKYAQTKNQGRVGSDDMWAIDAFLSDQGFPTPTQVMGNPSESSSSFAPGDSTAGKKTSDPRAFPFRAGTIYSVKHNSDSSISFAFEAAGLLVVGVPHESYIPFAFHKLRRRWLRVFAESLSLSTLIGLTPWPPCRNSKFIGYLALLGKNT